MKNYALASALFLAAAVPAVAETAKTGLSLPANLESFNLDAVSLGATVSTLGLGMEARYEINDTFAAVASVNSFSYTKSDNEALDGADLEGKLRFLTYGAGVEVMPFAGKGLRLGAGVYKNGNQISARATNRGVMEIGGLNFNSDEVTSLEAKIKYRSIAPYVSISYQQAITESWSIGAKVGAMFQGAGELVITPKGTLASQAVVSEAIARERAKVDKDLKKFKVMPILSLNVSYSF